MSPHQTIPTHPPTGDLHSGQVEGMIIRENLQKTLFFKFTLSCCQVPLEVSNISLLTVFPSQHSCTLLPSSSSTSSAEPTARMTAAKMLKHKAQIFPGELPRVAGQRQLPKE